ncbi:MAG: hypothetical protein WAV16_02620 [Candidatus Moraniibacteriota bacterium]
MNQKIMPVYLFVTSFFLLAGFATMVAIAKNDNANNNENKSEKSEKTEKSDKSSQSTKDGEKVVNLKDYKKADTTKGESNAKIHKEKTTEVIENLEQEQLQVQTENAGTEEKLRVETRNKAKKQIEEVATEQEASQEQVAEAIEEVENDGATKKFFLGPDYKNLGQLRSELVHNRNQIRKLTQAITALSQNEGDITNLQLQLQTLTQERERIKNIITTNQDGFSLFGWVSRFLTNYEETPINETEEEELITEVEETIIDDGVVDNIDAPIVTETSAPVTVVTP